MLHERVGLHNSRDIAWTGSISGFIILLVMGIPLVKVIKCKRARRDRPARQVRAEVARRLFDQFPEIVPEPRRRRLSA